MDEETLRQRVRIAKDVKEWIAGGNLIPMANGGYIAPRGRQRDIDKYRKQFELYWKENALREQYQTPEVCEVCAKGAFFCAAIDRYNSLEIGALRHPEDEVSGADMREYMTQWFTPDEFDLFETIFEYPSILYRGSIEFRMEDYSEHKRRQVRSFQRKHLVGLNEDGFSTDEDESPEMRANSARLLRAICNNIIRNKGRFKLSDV